MKGLIILSIIICVQINNMFGQLPFEKYPPIKYKEYNNWNLKDSNQQEKRKDYMLIIPNFFENNDSLTIVLSKYKTDRIEDSCMFMFYHKKDTVFGFGEFIIDSILDDPIRVADFNNDKRLDLKIIRRGWGCGAYNIYLNVYYLLQKPNNKLSEETFTDMMFETENTLERDFDGDGNYEIITMSFQNYKNHNYWVYNLYNFTSNGIVNVNFKDDYPIMIQLLNDWNDKITKNLTREQMKKYSKKLPDNYQRY